MFGNDTTKDRILIAAIELSAKHGFSNISMRNIAEAAGIKAPSIYNHLDGKRGIMLYLYDLYSESRKKAMPDLETLLKLTETKTMLEVLMMSDYHFPPEINDSMQKILIAAIHTMPANIESRDFIYNNVLMTPREITIPLIKRMIKIGRVEPFDIDIFDHILMRCCFSSVALIATPMNINVKEWKTMLESLFKAYVKPIA
jgi:AcrR family transcriptional regulator